MTVLVPSTMLLLVQDTGSLTGKHVLSPCYRTVRGLIHHKATKYIIYDNLEWWRSELNQLMAGPLV